jgi:hypothetical protein
MDLAKIVKRLIKKKGTNIVYRDDTQIMGISFAGIVVEDESNTELAVFNISDTRDSVKDEVAIMSMEQLAQLNRKMIIHETRKNGMVRLIDKSIQDEVVEKVIINYAEYINKHVVTDFRVLYSFASEDIGDDVYLKLADIIHDYPCILASSISDKSALIITVCE